MPALAEINRIEHHTLGEQVYRELRDMLISGRIAPGERTTLRGLSAALGTSAMPVRDALRHTAGRSSFITGQSAYRTGLSQVGIPAAPIGTSEKIITIAAALKNQGYATGQFGKNHLGDLNSMLPTNHGFDEFYGNLYHLNAEEEPELPDYPNEKDFPNFKKMFGPRGVMHSWAADTDDPTEEPRWGGVGKQKIEDSGPLTKKRMETCDDDFVARAKAFMKSQNDAGKPFFVWLNTAHMHLKTDTKPRTANVSKSVCFRCRPGPRVRILKVEGERGVRPTRLGGLCLFCGDWDRGGLAPLSKTAPTVDAPPP